ncbi:hypothetical protein JCM30237_05360 [Halolamina litorea]|uniref:Pilin/flagellin n=1 Tax=Halolamina litorea TaxID=1515593 RepID=A0ABD6BPA4_9EURY|nr:hypothetical protein [Halolamina litorea]
MADVDDRGQLLIVGAFTFAVMLVALAVLLNTAIYTGNVATRDAGPGTGEAIEYEGEAATMARDSLGAVNEREGATYADLRGNFTRAVDDWVAITRVHGATSLAGGGLEPVGDPTRGTLIEQPNERNFTSAATARNWTVANDSTVRAFRLNVTQDSLETPPDGDLVDIIFGEDERPNYFHVRIDDGAETWRIYFARDANDSVSEDVTLSVDHDGSSDACSAPADNGTVAVDITGAELGGSHCEPLENMTTALDDSYTVSYRNGVNGTGTYSLVSNRAIGRLDTGADTTGANDPTAERALYDATFRVTWRTADVYYQSELRIAPGEADD